ncbi:MAG TPA: SIMPL domain-containing protein [Gammaproteobacteria bacterium]
MKRIFTCLLLLCSQPLWADAGLPSERHIIVGGQGYVEAIPDIATIHIAVENTAPTLLQAKNKVDEITANAIKTVSTLGIMEEDIIASDIQASPQYDWTQNGQVYKGEYVSRSISITLRKIDQYSKLIHTLVKAGISRINNIELDFSAREQLQNKAMTKAIANAREKARVIAGGFGAKTGKIYKISETAPPSIFMPQAERLQALKAADSAEANASLQVGKQKIYQDIQAVFYLED